MKTSISIITLLLCFIISFAQDKPEVYRLKAFQVLSKIDNDKSPVKESDWQKRDIVVVINFDKNKIQAYGPKPMDIDLVKERDVHKTSEGNLFFEYDGVDAEGSKSLVTLIFYKLHNGDHLATLNVDYYQDNISIVFRLKRDE